MFVKAYGILIRVIKGIVIAGMAKCEEFTPSKS